MTNDCGRPIPCYRCDQQSVCAAQTHAENSVVFVGEDTLRIAINITVGLHDRSTQPKLSRMANLLTTLAMPQVRESKDRVNDEIAHFNDEEDE